MNVTMTPTRTEFDTDVASRIHDEPDYEDAPWWCVRTDPWRCLADGCDFVAVFATVAHLIVVWPEQDDPRLLKHAHLMKIADRNPRIVRWEAEYGRCIPFDFWEQIGRPTHHVRPYPEGWPGR